MHELHLVNDIFKDVLANAQKNSLTTVSKVVLRIGEFTEINPGIIRETFQRLSPGTIIEKAELEIQKSPVRELRLVSIEGE